MSDLSMTFPVSEFFDMVQEAIKRKTGLEFGNSRICNIEIDPRGVYIDITNPTEHIDELYLSGVKARCINEKSF